MKKLRSFSSLDLIVIIGLVLVLFGASLTMVGKTAQKSADNQRLTDASKVFNSIKSYHDSNFNLYPLPENLDSQSGYSFVVLSSADANFLKINLGSKYSSIVESSKYLDDLVYVYKLDGSEAAIVVRRLDGSADKCNTKNENVPQIIKEYLLRDPSGCYYQAK